MSGRSRLSPAHGRMLFEESGIGARVAIKRGYRTVTSKAELERLGFGRSQRNVPALLMPIYSPTGEIVLYQSRPNEPRIGNRGKPIKYETPSGASMAWTYTHSVGSGWEIPRCRSSSRRGSRRLMHW